MKKKFYILNAVQSLSLLVVIYVNYLANSVPINGMTTGELSALYPNYFVPAGITFSIWGIIYLLLMLYAVRSWFPLPGGSGKAEVYRYLWFILSGAGNAGWILAWHYQLVGLSMGLMLLLLYSLIRLYLITRDDPWTLRIPVSVYLGWITVATIANATALLVSLGWNGGRMGEPAWAIILMMVAAGLSSVMRFRFRDSFFQLVTVWAIFGIWLKFSVSALPAASLMKVAAMLLVAVMAVSLALPWILRRR